MSRLRFEQYLRERADLLDLPLNAAQLAALWSYYELLSKWNDKMNLTAHNLSSLDEKTLERVIVEPLAATKQVGPSVRCWMDVGSGGGSPAIPMRILLSDTIQLTMTEVRFKKAAFLRDAIRMLGLPGVEVHSGRFEELAQPQGRFDLVSSRAVRLDASALLALTDALKLGGILLSFGHQSGRDLQGFEMLNDDAGLTVFARSPT